MCLPILEGNIKVMKKMAPGAKVLQKTENKTENKKEKEEVSKENL